jgi:hypothetical protein
MQRVKRLKWIANLITNCSFWDDKRFKNIPRDIFFGVPRGIIDDYAASNAVLVTPLQSLYCCGTNCFLIIF